MKWLKNVHGNYVNLDHVIWLEAVGSGNSWILRATFLNSMTTTDLAGSWTSQAAAQEAAREIVEGVDTASYGD